MGARIGLASLTPRSNQLSQLACLCPPGNFYHPPSSRLAHSTHQTSLRNKDTCKHVVERPGNEAWQMLASQDSVLGFHKGRNATLESQVPGRTYSCLQQSSIGVSLERETPLIPESHSHLLVLPRRKVLTYVVVLIYFCNLSPKPYQMPISLAFNLLKKKICWLEHVNQSLGSSTFYWHGRLRGDLKLCLQVSFIWFNSLLHVPPTSILPFGDFKGNGVCQRVSLAPEPYCSAPTCKCLSTLRS